MNRTIVVCVMCLVGVGFLAAGTIILNFDAQPGFNLVTLKWTTENEINLKGFEIQRSFDNSNDNNFKTVDFVNANLEQRARKDYAYEDKSVFRQQQERTYYYRLKIVDKDNSFTLSRVISVSPTISSARQTWGSIKAMFR
ncbi:MAG TPA: hypothetical protein VGA99_12130 [bacterium]